MGTALLMVALIVTLAFSVTSLGVSHLNLTNRSSNSVRALNLARSAVALGYEKLLADSELRYGQDRAPGNLLSYGVEDRDGAYLTFSTADAEPLGLAWSTNNLVGSQPVDGWGGRVVPRGMAQLVGVGRYRGTERVVEVLLVMPPYPFAIACGGAISASGGLIIGTVDPTRPAPTSPDDLGPADLVSNDSSPTSVRLGPGSRVRGNLKTAGDVELDQGNGTTGPARVDGQLTTYAGPSRIPEMDIARLDPGAGADPLGAEDVQDLTVAGSARRAGNLTVAGTLHLEGGLLYVDGNLEAHSIDGEGTVVATGHTFVNGTTQLGSSAGLALISGGRLELKGTGRNSSRLRGLVYTNHSFKCEEITLEGALVANGPEGTLNEFVSSSVWKNPEVATVPGEPAVGSSMTFSYLSSGATGGTTGATSTGGVVGTGGAGTGVVGSGSTTGTTTGAVGGTGTTSGTGATGGSGPAPTPNPDSTARIDVIDHLGQTFVATLTRDPSTNGIVIDVAEIGGRRVQGTSTTDAYSDVWSTIVSLTASLGATPGCGEDAMQPSYVKWLEENQPVSGGGGHPPVPPEELPDLNLSQLLPPPSRVRVAMWRE